MKMPKRFSTLWVTGFFCIVLIFLGLASTQIKAPAIEDEVLMHKGALIWLEKGADRFEMSHTPMYLESTSIWQKIIGTASAENPANIWKVRSFGLFTMLVTLSIFVWGLLKIKLKSSHYLLLTSLFLLAPYTIQSALLLDYDTTVLIGPLLLASILIEQWDSRETPSLKQTSIIGLVLGIALFAKEITPCFFLLGWAVFSLLRKFRTGKKSFVHLKHSIFGIGVALFSFVLFLNLWSLQRGFHWYDPLMLTLNKFLLRKDSGGMLPWKTWGISRFLFLNYIPLLWINIPFIVLFFMTCYKKIELKKLPFSFLMSIVVYLGYFFLVQASFYFPKYTAPAWPLLILGFAKMGFSEVNFKSSKNKLLPIALVSVLFFIGFSENLDPLLIIENRTDLTSKNILQHLISIGLPLFILFLYQVIQRSKKISLVSFFGVLALFLGTDLRHTRQLYESRYLYGESGFLKAADELKKLKSQVSPDKPILTVTRDLDWYLQDKSNYFEMAHYKRGAIPLKSYKILVSRTYGFYSIRAHQDALDEVEGYFRCHKFIDSKGKRFEWWWNPDLKQNCE